MKKTHNYLRVSTMILLLFAAVIFSGNNASAAGRVCHIEISAENLGQTSTFYVEGKQVTVKATGVRNAFQQVLDYAKNLSNIEGASYDSLEIKLKKGQYKVDGTLFIYSNTSIVCEDGTEVRSDWDYGTLLRTAPLRLLGNVKVSDEMVQNISVTGGKWNGMNKPGTIFRFTHTSNIVIDGVEVANLKDTGHLIALEAVKNVTIQNSKFYNHTISAGAKETESSEAIHIDYTRGAADISAAEETDYPCSNIVIQNNIIHDVPTGIGSHTAMNGVTHKNITIVNNEIYNTKGNAIRAYRYRNTLIQGNNIHNAAGAISVNTTGTNVYEPKKTTVKEAGNSITGVSILSNTIQNVSGNAIWLTGSNAYRYSGVQIVGNYLNNTKSTSITVRDYCNSTKIEGNTILNSGQYAIQANNNCNKLNINANTITNSKKHAIAVRLNSHNASITNNNLSGLSEAGVVVYTKCNNATISGNTVNQPSADGILVKDNCKNAAILSNKVISGKKCGITVMNKVAEVKISGNHISNAKSSGIYVKDSVTKAYVSSNTITNPLSMGISFINKCNNAKVLKNKITGGTYGVSVKDSCSKALVKSNTIANTKKNSIQYVNKCNNGTISYNTINNSKASGIYIMTKSVKNKVLNNKITTVAHNGISLANGADQTTLTGNTVKNVKNKGIYTKSVKKTVSKSNKLINCKKK